MNKEDWILIISVSCSLLGVIGGFKIASWALDRDLAVARHGLSHILHAGLHHESRIKSLLIFCLLFQRPIRPVTFGRRVILRAGSFEKITALSIISSVSDEQTLTQSQPLATPLQGQNISSRLTYLNSLSNDQVHTPLPASASDETGVKP
jgi:hypothetical protein